MKATRATTSRRWINPEDTWKTIKPSNQATIRMTANAASMDCLQVDGLTPPGF
jgi:hypothetical protein